MKRKTDSALAFFRAGMFREAFALFKGFRMGFSEDERRSIQIAHEALAGHSSFYSCLGMDTDAEIERSKQIITEKYPT